MEVLRVFDEQIKLGFDLLECRKMSTVPCQWCTLLSSCWKEPT